MWVLKAVILTITATIFAYAITPPRPAVRGVQVYKGQPLEYIVRYLAWLGCILVIISSTCHTALLVLHALGAAKDEVVPYLCPSTTLDTGPLILLTPQFIVGSVLLIVGGSFRLWCYQVLGDLFTYEVHVKDDHTLVTTGPYAYIRHPSYTGLTTQILGAQLIHFGAGSYVTECGIEGTPMIVFVRIWQWGSLFGLLSLYRRCSIEDAQLQGRFGVAWENYRRNVQYRLIPFVF